MKSIIQNCKKVLLPLFLFCPFLLNAESFRVAKMHKMMLPDDYSAVTSYSGIFDGVAIVLPEDRTFITGIELTIKIPETVAQWRDTVAYLFYNDITPSPSENTIDYTGNRTSLNTIPGRLNQTVYIPLSRKFSIKESPYAKTLDPTVRLTDNCVFFRFMLAMKGAPESLEHAQFELSVRPVLSSEGYFSLNVKEPDGKKADYKIYIDDQSFSSKPEKIILKEGEHHLSITSDDYRNEVRTFIVEQAKHTKVNVELRGIEPVIRIISPENAKVFFDGKPFTQTKDSFTATPGSHTIKFVIGDYEVVKNINADNGRSYTVNLTVDATITEEE